MKTDSDNGLEKEKEKKRQLCENSKRRQAKLVAQGLCCCCGKNPLFTKTLCQPCNEKRKPKLLNSGKARRNRYKNAGLCYCGKETAPGKKCCQECLDRQAARMKKLYDERADKGLCIRCGKYPRRRPDDPAAYCQLCCLKSIARRSFGNESRAEDLKKLFLQQKGICPETGLKIRLGETASLDHKIAKKRGGSDDLDNLRWVHKWVNIAKNECSEEEFHDFILRVVRHKKLLSSDSSKNEDDSSNEDLTPEHGNHKRLWAGRRQ